MRIFLKLALFAATLATFGCAHNHYNVPQETLEKKVKVVGVATFFIDAESDIKHPEKTAVVTLMTEVNRKNEKELIARLRETGIFYSVRQVDEEPARLFTRLLVSRERRDDAGIVYNKYFFRRQPLKELLDANGLDAVMLVTVNGLTRKGKVYSSNFLSYLETDFNYLSLSAELLDGDGNILWEFPNFRQRSLSYPTLFSLQYPDFDEAAANLNEQVDVKFKTVAGIAAAFAKTEPSAIENGTRISTLYGAQLDEIISLLKTARPLFGNKKDAPAAATAVPVAPVLPAAAAPAPVIPAAAPAPIIPAAALPVPPPPAPAAAAAPAPEAITPPAPIQTQDLKP
jgi:hypothetical protein